MKKPKSLLLPTVFALLASGVALRAQTITEIPFPMIPMSIFDLDAAGGEGPTTLAEINAAASPRGGELLDMVMSQVSGPDPYNNFTNGRGLGADASGNPILVDPPAGVFHGFGAEFTMQPSKVFGVAIADWHGPIAISFFSGSTHVASLLSSTYVTPEMKYYRLDPGGGFVSFDRVLIQNDGFVIPELAVQISPANLEADFRAVPQGCSANTIQLTDVSPGGPTFWGWDVDNDGTLDYTTQNPVHTYPGPGTYDCRLTVGNATSASVVTMPVHVGGGDELATVFNSNNGGTVGGAIYFDVTVRQPIRVDALTTNYDVQVGSPVGMVVHTTPYTHTNKETDPTAWTQVAIDDGTATSAGFDQPTAIRLATPFTLQPGRHGIALVAVGDGHRYTSAISNAQSYATAALTLHAGTASNVPFSGPVFDPRLWNGSLQYEHAAGFENHGFATPSGMPGVQPPSLTTIIAPTAGQVGVLSMQQYDHNALGFLAAGFGRRQVGPWGVYNMGTELLAVLLAAPMPIGVPHSFGVVIPSGCGLNGLSLNFVHVNIVPGSPNFLSMSNGCEWFVFD